MTTPVDPEPAPAVPWTPPPAADATPVEEPGPSGARRVLDVITWAVALVVAYGLASIRASLQTGLDSSERLGYILGGVGFSLLLAAAIRWVWLRFRRRTHPTTRLLSPWIPVGAVIILILGLLGSPNA